jgi:glutathione S-transferase
VHAGFGALRAAMPVNTRARGRVVERSAEVEADIARAAEIWGRHRPGGWLFGEFGGADIIFAPIATRFQTYGVTLSGAAAAYQERILAHPLVREWLRLGEQETGMIPVLEVG